MPRCSMLFAPHFGKLPLERRSADPEELRCLRAISARLFERLEDVLAFARIERTTGVFDGVRRSNVGRKVIDGDALAAAQDERAFERVAKLADVARPSVAFERLERLPFDRHGLSKTLG